MRDIGFQQNYAMRRSFRTRLSPSLVNRIALMDSILRREGYRLFVYSPRSIRADQGSVRGFEFLGGRFSRREAELPRVNGNWTHRTRRLLDKGMGFQDFMDWVDAREMEIYVPHAFSELIGNKLETYKLVRGFHEALHPQCELYVNTREQIEHFLDTGALTFIKPRTGSKGDRIVTVRRDATGLLVTRYLKGQKEVLRASRLADAMEFIGVATSGKRKYVIQHGVETMRFDGSTFDVRVTMLHDGQRWHFLHEARLSPSGSDVSNVSQGGRILVTEDLLDHLVGAEAAHELLRQLQSESFGLATYLERLHPGEINELAFDFAVDHAGRLRLLEVNTKPGLAGIGSSVSVFDKTRAQEADFERWVYPHTECLARFLLEKARSAGS